MSESIVPAEIDPGPDSDPGLGGDLDPTLEAELAPLPLLELSDGLPRPIETFAELQDAVRALGSVDGPVGVDVERASGYRYGQRAYLVQLRRPGTPTVLIDPIGCPDLSEVSRALRDAEWVLHAANQDLPGLAELGMRPERLFDTELAARLAGFERVGLATMVPLVLGLRLEKGHSAADWSQRPLSDEMLHYAALDVEPLIPLRDHLEAVLREQGKTDWARQEFEAVRTAPPAKPRAEPWRRTSGIHRLRTRRQLAIVRALWEARDAIARRNDTAPGRVLQDSAIVEAALAAPKTIAELEQVRGFTGRGARRRAATWLAAVLDAAAEADEALPTSGAREDATPPPTARWSERDPVAAARLARMRVAVSSVAITYQVPAENLLEPAVVRRLAWAPPPQTDPAAVRAALTDLGARPWQIELTAERIADALVQ